MKYRASYTCPLELTQDMMKGKWKPVILWQLGKGTASLAQLRKSINGISQKMLLEHLKELQQVEVVGKKQYEGYPLKVEYFLTERGQRFFKVVMEMQQIGVEMMLEDGKEELLRSKGLIE